MQHVLMPIKETDGSARNLLWTRGSSVAGATEPIGDAIFIFS
jgi:hypothetical protein